MLALFRTVLAATLEYLSMLPSFRLLFELLPAKWSLLQLLARVPVIRLPICMRLWIAKLLPEYDPYLRAWPHSALEYEEFDPAREHHRKRIRKLLLTGRWLDAYEHWWACRRPATRRRLTLPLYRLLGGDERPALATLGVFLWSGLLHALWYPLIPVYIWLSQRDKALSLFIILVVLYTLLGLPIVIHKGLRHRRNARNA